MKKQFQYLLGNDWYSAQLMPQDSEQKLTLPKAKLFQHNQKSSIKNFPRKTLFLIVPQFLLHSREHRLENLFRFLSH